MLGQEPAEVARLRRVHHQERHAPRLENTPIILDLAPGTAAFGSRKPAVSGDGDKVKIGIVQQRPTQDREPRLAREQRHRAQWRH